MVQALALMVTLFRLSILLAVALVAVATVLPFARPLSVDLPLHGLPPTWVLGCFFLLIAALVGVPASVGLLRLRRWGRFLGACTAVAALLGVMVAFRSPIAAAAGPVIGAMFVAGILVWLGGVGMAFHPSVAARFRA